MNSPDEEVKSRAMKAEKRLFEMMCPRNKSFQVKNHKEKYDICANTVSELDNLYNLGIKKFKTSGRGDKAKEEVAIRRFLDVAVKNEKARLTFALYV